MIARRLILLTTAATILIAPGADARRCTQGGGGPEPSLRRVAIQAADAGGGVSVSIDADGALPRPVSGALENPPRIYVDLKGVQPGRGVEADGGDPRILRIRIARHTVTPLVTRVVLDLANAAPYRLDASARDQGRVRVIIGGARDASSGQEGSSAGEGGGVRAARAAAPRSSTRAPSRADTYAAEVAAPVARLQALRPLLVSIDRRSAVAGDPTAAAAELDAIARVLSALKPPPARETTHVLLLRVCAMGGRALRLRQESAGADESAAAWNAASAAAGAVIMLDRARADLAGPAAK